MKWYIVQLAGLDVTIANINHLGETVTLLQVKKRPKYFHEDQRDKEKRRKEKSNSHRKVRG